MPPAAGGLAHRLRALEREHVRELWRKLDAIIPPEYKQKPHRNAGARALGAEGRAAADILSDCIAYVKEIRSKGGADLLGSGTLQGLSDGGHRRSVARDHPSHGRDNSVTAATRREGLLSAHGLFCVEVEMQEPLQDLVRRRWMMRRVGKGAGILVRKRQKRRMRQGSVQACI